MINQSFEHVSQSIFNNLKGRNFTTVESIVGKDDIYKSVFASDKRAFCLSYDLEGKKFILDTASVNEGETGEFKNVSVWLFDPDTDAPNELRSVCNEFNENISDVIIGKAKINAPAKNVRAPQKVKTDYETFCQKAVELYPAFADIYEENISRNGKLDPDEFAVDSLGKYMMEMLAQKKNAQTKKLFEFLNNMFASGDDDVASIVVVTLFGMLLDNEESMQLAEEKYMNETVAPVWKYTKKILIKNRKKAK